MNPQDISNKKFEKSMSGYKTEEVDEYLRDVAIAYAKAIKEKEENELKIVKLVEKINEYRGDEDAIRDALLVAQKQGNRTAPRRGIYRGRGSRRFPYRDRLRLGCKRLFGRSRPQNFFAQRQAHR